MPLWTSLHEMPLSLSLLTIQSILENPENDTQQLLSGMNLD